MEEKNTAPVQGQGENSTRHVQQIQHLIHIIIFRNFISYLITFFLLPTP